MVSAPSRSMTSNLRSARLRLAAKRPGGIASKSRKGWYSSTARPRSAACPRIRSAGNGAVTRSLSKISTPWNLACAIAASFSGSVPLTDTVAIDLRMPVCSLPRGISRPGVSAPPGPARASRARPDRAPRQDAAG